MFFKCSSQRSVEEPVLLTMRYKIIKQYSYLSENDVNKLMMDVPEACIKILYRNRRALHKLALSMTCSYAHDPYFNLLITLHAENMSEFFATLATLGKNVSLNTTHELLLLAHQQQKNTKLAMPIAEAVCESRSPVA